MHAWIYLKASGNEHLCEGPFLSEYSRQLHEECYRPIEHILVKQVQYLEGKVSTWGLVDAPFNPYSRAST